MPFIAATFDTGRRRRMTTQDWWDAGLTITLTFAAVGIAYLIVLITQ